MARKKNTQEKVHEEHRYSGIGGSGSKATSNENREGVGKSEQNRVRDGGRGTNVESQFEMRLEKPQRWRGPGVVNTTPKMP